MFGFVLSVLTSVIFQVHVGDYQFHSIVANDYMFEFLLHSRAMGDNVSAVTYYEESVEFLSKTPVIDLEVILKILVS